MMGYATERIDQVIFLKSKQFSEDSGPLSHPIRPDSYISMDNFYTSTVYDKGAEIVRMLKTILGTEGFIKGFDLYIKRHDNAAVTCEDFVNAMAGFETPYTLLFILFIEVILCFFFRCE